jgi:hypothetical protein
MARASACLVAMIALVPVPARAQGGPPLLTDDPDTPGPGYWEINVSTFFEKNTQGRTVEVPRLDVNYGVGRRIQLKFEVPWVSARDADGNSRTGAGKAVLGVKWRFLGQEGTKIAWATYPQFNFNPAHSSVSKRLVEDGYRMLVPTEVTAELAHVEINGEVGRNFVEHGQGNWIYGLSTEGSLSPRLELLAELHGETFPEGPNELIVNVGARRKLTRKLILMLAAGRAVRGTPEKPGLILYTGIQFDLPGLYAFKQADPRRAGSPGLLPSREINGYDRAPTRGAGRSTGR